MRNTAFLILFLVCCIGCKESYDHKGKTILVEIDHKFLYQEDVYPLIPVGLSSNDSIVFVNNYIKNWVENVLLYEKAEHNIPDSKKIERQVERYRQSLILHTYQHYLLEQKLGSELQDSIVENYYDNNKLLFCLEQPMVKGLFMKIPLKAPKLNKVRQWCKNDNQESIDKLEKYSFQNAVKYDYFYDRWVSLENILAMIPLQVDVPEKYIDKNRYIEYKDTAYYYFLNVSDIIHTGEEMPYEIAKPEVIEVLQNMRQVDFMKSVKENLYKQAVNQNRIVYNTKNKE